MQMFMRSMRSVALLSVLFLKLFCSAEYDESIRTMLLPGGRAVHSFEFSFVHEQSRGGAQQNSFPSVFFDLWEQHGVTEQELALTQGAWRYDAWGRGYGDGSAFFPAPAGGFVRVQTVNGVEPKLGGVLNSLFRTSLGDLQLLQVPGSLYFEALRVVEPACTENVQAVIALLPSLQTAKAVHDIGQFKHDYLSVHVIFSKKGDQLELALSVHIVDSSQSISNGNVTMKTQDMQQPSQYSGKYEASVLNNAARVLQTDDSNTYNLQTIYSVPAITFNRDLSIPVPTPIVIHERSVDTFTLNWVQITTRQMFSSAEPVQFIHRATVPWRLGGVFTHQTHSSTHKVHVSVLPSRLTIDHCAVNIDNLCISIYPSSIQQDAAVLVRGIAHRSADFTLHIQKFLFHVDSYQADTSRGIDVPAAYTTVNSDQQRYFSTAMQIDIPFPDQSMLFNVVAIACTVVAFFVGSQFNLLYNSDQDFALLVRTTRTAKIIAVCRRQCNRTVEPPHNALPSSNSHLKLE